MTPEELSAYFERIRARQREIQLNVYRTRTAAAYHIGNARDMVADNRQTLSRCVKRRLACACFDYGMSIV